MREPNPSSSTRRRATAAWLGLSVMPTPRAPSCCGEGGLGWRGGLEVVRAAAEVRARVRQGVVEPEAVELERNLVVVADRLSIATRRVPRGVRKSVKPAR